MEHLQVELEQHCQWAIHDAKTANTWPGSINMHLHMSHFKALQHTAQNAIFDPYEPPNDCSRHF